ATPEIYTLSLHDALPISLPGLRAELMCPPSPTGRGDRSAEIRNERKGSFDEEACGCTAWFRCVRSSKIARLRIQLMHSRRRVRRSEEHTSELQSRENLVC